MNGVSAGPPDPPLRRDVLHAGRHEMRYGAFAQVRVLPEEVGRDPFGRPQEIGI